MLPNEGCGACQLGERARAGPHRAAERASLNAPASRLGSLGRLDRSPGTPGPLAWAAWGARRGRPGRRSRPKRSPDRLRDAVFDVPCPGWLDLAANDSPNDSHNETISNKKNDWPIDAASIVHTASLCCYRLPHASNLVYIYIYKYTHTHTHIYIYIYIYICIFACMYVFM